MKDCASYSQACMKKGSLSFSLAALLFPRRTRVNVAKLYAWCRHADDLVDRGSQKNFEDMTAQLKRLEAESLGLAPPSLAATLGLQELRSTVGLSPRDVGTLLSGMTMDCREVRIHDEAELDLYCHRVAGVVGHMMCAIMGVSDQGALPYANALGKAMQLTNICRDVAEDFEMGRVYLPATLLGQYGISDPSSLMESKNRAALVGCVREILDRADGLYRLGAKGLSCLPLRAALAVAAAREIYQAIGDEVRSRGEQAWDRRVWIPGWKKIFLAANGILAACGAKIAGRRRLARFESLQGI